MIKLEPFHPRSKPDFEWIKEFLHSYHDTTPAELQPELDDLRNPKISWFRAFHNRKFIGLTAYKKLSPTYAEIVKTVLIPSERGKGLGSAVAEAIVEQVKNDGYHKVLSIVYTHNLPMLIIRLKQGFLVEGLSRNADAPGLHEYILGKELHE